MSIEIRIVCDRCMKVEPNAGWGFLRGGAKPHLLRRVLRKLGWQTALPRGDDLCSKCAKEAKQEAKGSDAK